MGEQFYQALAALNFHLPLGGGFKIFQTFFLGMGAKDEVCQRLFAYFKLNLSFL